MRVSLRGDVNVCVSLSKTFSLLHEPFERTHAHTRPVRTLTHTKSTQKMNTEKVHKKVTDSLPDGFRTGLDSSGRCCHTRCVIEHELLLGSFENEQCAHEFFMKTK